MCTVPGIDVLLTNPLLSDVFCCDHVMTIKHETELAVCVLSPVRDKLMNLFSPILIFIVSPQIMLSTLTLRENAKDLLNCKPILNLNIMTHDSLDFRSDFLLLHKTVSVH